MVRAAPICTVDPLQGRPAKVSLTGDFEHISYDAETWNDHDMSQGMELPQNEAPPCLSLVGWG